MKSCSVKSLLAVFLCSGAIALQGAWQPAGGAVIHPRPVSKSMWIWAADKPIKKGSEALFRFNFNLPTQVKAAVVKVNYDDGGRLWINGKYNAGRSTHSGTRVYDLAGFMKQGKNCLAVKVVNGEGIAGMLLYGEIKLVNGKSIFLHSTADTKSISGPRQDKWYMPQFDDSKWQKSLVHGDILSAPWSRYRDLTCDFFTPVESKNYNDRERKSLELPASLAKEKFQPSSVVMKDGMPHFKIGDQYLWPIYDLVPGGNIYHDSWIIRHGALGMKIFQVGQSEETFLKPDGTLTFERTDKSVRRVLNLVPDAKILLYFKVAYMQDFCKKNPEEAMIFGTGKLDYKGELYGRPLRPSPASVKMRAVIEEWMTKLAAFVHKQPWAKRVMGVRVCYGTYGEWHSYGMFQAPDLSKPMQKAFRKYLKNKYKTVAALRKAWRDPGVTFDTASVPTVKERWGKDRFFRCLKLDAKELDFYDCYAHTHADLLLFMAELSKKLFPGRLCGAYYGYPLCNHPPEGATVLLDKVASSPYIDYLSCPPPYTPVARLAGGDNLSRGISNTLLRYGKVQIIEDDSRFHHIPKYSEKNISTRSALESRQILRRNMFNMLFERCGTQFCDPINGKETRPCSFDDPAMDLAIKESLPAMKKALPLAGDSGNEIAVVYNYMERLRHHAPNFYSRQILGHFVNSMTLPQLYRSGFAFDLLSHTDFFASKKKYKVYIFLNAFTNTAAERKAIKAKIRRKGVTAIFLNAAGYVTPEGFSTAAMEDLTGMKIAVDKKGKNSDLVFDNKSGISGTWNRGPEQRFHVSDPGACAFGRYAADRKIGAAVKKLSDGSKVIYSGNYPLKAAQWHKILLKTGLKPAASPGSYFRRHGNLVMFHTGIKGNHTIALPRGYKGAFELFTGKKYTDSTISVTSSAGPATWVFKCF